MEKQEFAFPSKGDETCYCKTFRLLCIGQFSSGVHPSVTWGAGKRSHMISDSKVMTANSVAAAADAASVALWTDSKAHPLPRLHPQHQWKVVLESQCCLLPWELQQGPVLGSGQYTNTLICQHLFLFNFSIDSIEFMNSCKMSNHPTGCHFNLVEVSLTKDTISIFFVCLRAIVHFLQLAVH